MTHLDNSTSHPLFDIIERLRAEEARWAATVADEAAFPVRVLFGQGFICRSLGLALNVRNVEGGVEMTPVFVKPDLLGGFSRMNREDAERIAASHPGGFTVEHIKDTAQNRLREIRETLEAVASIPAT